MAEASKTMTMAVSPESLLKVIRDFEKYPEFVEGCHTAKIVSSESSKTRVAYSIEIMSKAVPYTLDHYNEDNGVRWQMVDSNLLKSNSGRWILQDLGGGKTQVTYELALDFKIPVPGFILGGLIKSSLPVMIGSFEKRVLALGLR